MRAAKTFLCLVLALLFLPAHFGGSLPVKAGDAFAGDVSADGAESRNAFKMPDGHIEYGHPASQFDGPAFLGTGFCIRPLTVDLPQQLHSLAPPELIAAWHFHHRDALRARAPTSC